MEMMFKLTTKKITRLNILLFIVGLTLGGAIGFAIIQNSQQPAEQQSEQPTTETETNESVATIEQPQQTIGATIEETPSSDTAATTDRVVMYEFSDFECPYCQKYFLETYPKIKENYIDTGKIEYIFINFPLPTHRNAKPAAIAVECAKEQNKFQEMHDTLFQNQSEWDSSPEPDQNFAVYAQELDLNIDEYESCVASEQTLQKVNEEITFAKEKDISQTPSFYVNDQKLVGAHEYATFEEVINKALQD